MLLKYIVLHARSTYLTHMELTEEKHKMFSIPESTEIDCHYGGTPHGEHCSCPEHFTGKTCETGIYTYMCIYIYVNCLLKLL